MTSSFYRTRHDVKSHPAIIVELDDASRLTPDWLLGYFDEEVTAGRVFKAGETVGVGWGLLLLREAETGKNELEVWEPDFASMPIRWVPGINMTQRHLVLQKSNAEALSLGPVFPSLLQPCSVGPSWQQYQSFHLWRETNDEPHSGWVVGHDVAVDTVDLCSLYEVGCHLPVAIPFFALPAGAVVDISRRRIEMTFGERCVSSDDNALLGSLLERARLPSSDWA
jgi:hypothetical protein